MKKLNLYCLVQVVGLLILSTEVASSRLLKEKDYFEIFGDEAADFYRQGEYEKAIEVWTKKCKDGEARSCHMLGMIYYYGKGVEKNTETAIEYWQKACKGEYSGGCFEAGVYYEQDKGKTQENLQMASDFYEKGCKLGQNEACHNLMILIEKKEFKPKSPDTLTKVYQYSCDNKDYVSCAELGYLYTYGKGGLPEDYVKAIELATLACEHDIPIGCNNLGYMYATGKGVELDFSKAKPLFEKACHAKKPIGCENLEELLEKESKKEH